MVTTQAAATNFTNLIGSTTVQNGIDALVDALSAEAARITGPRAPSADLKTEYDDLLKRAGDIRGRAMWYPAIGSGLGNGALVELADGRVVWDMITGIGVQFFGHSHPELARAAIAASLEDTVKQGNLQSNWRAYEFCESLLSEASRGSRLRHCFLSTSGAMANESAVKICYQKTGGSRVIAFDDCFMGRSVTMSQLGDSAGNRQGVPLSTLVDYMPFYSASEAREFGQARYIDMQVRQLEKYITRYPGQHACMIFELVQGEGGFNTAPREFFVALMDVCRANKIPIWDDEIQSFGRTEAMFAYDMMNVGEYVDVLTVGKMTQACATLFTPDFNPKPGLLSGTFTGESQSFAVGAKILDMLRSGNFYGANGSNARHHRLFREQVDALARKHPAWFTKIPGVEGFTAGVGGMMRLSPFGGDKDKMMKACKACFDAGVVLFYCGHGPYHLRMLPPLGVMKESDWPRVFEAVEVGLSRV